MKWYFCFFYSFTQPQSSITQFDVMPILFDCRMKYCFNLIFGWKGRTSHFETFAVPFTEYKTLRTGSCCITYTKKKHSRHILYFSCVYWILFIWALTVLSSIVDRKKCPRDLKYKVIINLFRYILKRKKQRYSARGLIEISFDWTLYY